jgi:uncharacterized membrane protein
MAESVQVRAQHVRGGLGRVRRRVRAGVVQLLGALAGAALGLLLPLLRVPPTVPADKVSGGLITLGFGLLSVISVIFSLLYLVAQWAFANFTPRLSSFVDEPIIWRSFALAIGVFVYSLVAALARADRDKVTFLVPLCDLLAVLVVLGLIRGIQFRAFSAIRLGPTLTQIVEQGRAAITGIYPTRFEGMEPGNLQPAGTPDATVHWPHPAATAQQIDVARLVRLAADANAIVVLRVGVGDTLYRDAPVADCFGGEVPADRLLGAILSGDHRTSDQDPMLAVRLLADIALRALSPAVNDPATACQAVEALAHLLGLLAQRDLDVAAAGGERGNLRVILAMPGWEQYVGTAFDDVIEAAAGSPLALRQVHADLTRLRGSVPGGRGTALDSRARRTDTLLAERFPHLSCG